MFLVSCVGVTELSSSNQTWWNLQSSSACLLFPICVTMLRELLLLMTASAEADLKAAR